MRSGISSDMNFTDKVIEMRKAQKEFFSLAKSRQMTKRKLALEKAKELEKVVDGMLEEINGER